MTRYHINYRGEPGVCKAKYSCPFGDMETEHYFSESQARNAYEGRMISLTKEYEVDCDLISYRGAKSLPSFEEWLRDKQWEAEMEDDARIEPGDRVSGAAVEHSIHDHEWDTGIVEYIDRYGHPVVKWEMYPNDYHEFVSREE